MNDDERRTASDLSQDGEPNRYRAYVTGIGWCWMADGEIVEVIVDVEECEMPLKDWDR
ncbi:MAG: hypothetical protein KDH88_07460 [Chromatiales bacterium]|nr:hypothetical protein [Chromatiales bacterium]